MRWPIGYHQIVKETQDPQQELQANQRVGNYARDGAQRVGKQQHVLNDQKVPMMNG